MSTSVGVRTWTATRRGAWNGSAVASSRRCARTGSRIEPRITTCAARRDCCSRSRTRTWSGVTSTAAARGAGPVLVCEDLTGATLSYVLEQEDPGGSARPISATWVSPVFGVAVPARPGLPAPGRQAGQHHLKLGATRLIDLSLACRPGRVPPGYGTPGYLSPEQAVGDLVGAADGRVGCRPGAVPVRHRDPTLRRRGPGRTGRLVARTIRRDRLGVRPPPGSRASPAARPAAETIDACVCRAPEARPTLKELVAALATLCHGAEETKEAVT